MRGKMITAKEVQETRKQILEGDMTEDQKKWFNELYDRKPMYDTAQLIVAAKDAAEDEKITREHGEAQAKMLDLEQRKETCAFKYLNEKTDINDADTRRKVMMAFYRSDNPEELLGKSINEVLQTLKGA